MFGDGRRSARLTIFASFAAAVMTLPSCGPGEPGEAATRTEAVSQEPAPAVPSRPSGLSDEQRLRAEKLINNFEHGTTEFRYGSAEDLGDGRGITFGRAGFTTRTGDGLELVRRYTKAVPGNLLAGFVPRLEELARANSGSVDGLDGFREAVRAAADDPAFRRVQDSLQEELYYRPSAEICDRLGLKSALSRAAVYDAILMHGEGDDPDGLPALIEQARKAAGGTPAAGTDEAAWLTAFFDVRREDLLHPHDARTHGTWEKSAGRVEVFRHLAKQGNWELHGPIVLRGEYTGIIP